MNCAALTISPSHVRGSCAATLRYLQQIDVLLDESEWEEGVNQEQYFALQLRQ